LARSLATALFLIRNHGRRSQLFACDQKDWTINCLDGQVSGPDTDVISPPLQRFGKISAFSGDPPCTACRQVDPATFDMAAK